MSAEAQGLQIPVGLSLEEAQLALRQLEQMARDAGKRIKKTGDEAGDGFADSISKWRRSEMKEGRQVGFLVDQFTGGLVPATGAAREGVNLLTKALIGGVGLSLGLDIAGAGARLLYEWWEKETKAEEEAKKAAEEHGKVLRTLAADTEAYTRGLFGSTASLDFLYSKQRDFNEKTYADRKRLDEIQKEIWVDEMNGASTSNALLEERTKIVDKLKIAENEWNAARGEFRKRQEADELAARAKLEAEIAKAMKEARIAADNKLFEERYNLAQEHAKKMKEMRSQVERSEIQEQLDAEAAFASARAQKAIDKEKAERDAAKVRKDAYNAADDAEFTARYEMELARDRAYVEAENVIFISAYEQRLAAERELSQLGTDALRGLVQQAVSSFGPILTHSRAYAVAMRAAGREAAGGADLSAAAFAKMGQEMLASIAQQATVKAAFEVAEALATQGLTWGVPNGASVNHWAAAAAYGGVAGLAGLGAVAIGQTRGMTRGERASLSGGGTVGAPALEPSSGAREVGGTGGGVAQVQTRVVEIVYGGDLFTPQELAQAHARRQRIAEDLRLLRAP